DKHPLTVLGGAAGHWEWGLFVLETVVLAPILEELVFRGLLLPWLAQKRVVPPETPLTVPPSRRPLLGLLLAGAFPAGASILLHRRDISQSWEQGDHTAAAAHLVPGAFFLALVPLHFLVPRLRGLRRHLRIRGTRQVQAVLASSALFAAFHAAVWPSPVPL